MHFVPGVSPRAENSSPKGVGRGEGECFILLNGPGLVRERSTKTITRYAPAAHFAAL